MESFFITPYNYYYFLLKVPADSPMGLNYKKHLSKKLKYIIQLKEVLGKKMQQNIQNEQQV